jgi:uncharacterized OB-fold protein
MEKNYKQETEKPFEIPYTDWKPEYLYSLAEVSKFFKEIVDNKRLFGSKCPNCSKTWMPPRGYCPDCYEATEWVQLNGEGTVMACTYCYFIGMSGDLLKFIDLPYVYALIKLDGTDTYMAHGIRPKRQSMGEINKGTRVKVVFREERRGTIADFYFEAI